MLTTYAVSEYEDSQIVREKLYTYVSIVRKHVSSFFTTDRTIALQQAEDAEIEEYVNFFNYLSVLNTYQYRDEWQNIIDELVEQLDNVTSELTLSSEYHQHHLTLLHDPSITEYERCDIQKNYDDFMKYTGQLNKKQKKQLLQIEKKEYQASTAYDAMMMRFKKNASCILSTSDLDDMDPSILSALKQGPSYYIVHDNALAHHILKESTKEYVRIKIYNFLQSLGSAHWNLEPYINTMMDCRIATSQLYNYNSYSNMALEKLMVHDGDTILSVIEQLGHALKPTLIERSKHLQHFATKENISFAPYNLEHIEARYNQEIFGVTAESFRVYFNVSRTIEHLHQWIEQHYQLSFETVQQDLWHEDVLIYCIRKNEEILAYLYLDLFERVNKQNGAFFSPQQSRNFLHGATDVPVGILSTSFRKDENHHIYWSDVQTLWHEYGHALHHFLVDSPYSEHTGMFVEDDAIELPSTMMELFLNNYDIIREIARHPDTGESMSYELYQTFMAYDWYHSLDALYRTLLVSYFDLLMHHQHMKPRDAWEKTYDSFNVYTSFPINYSEMTRIDHLYTGGYGSLYYSYVWADIMSHDIVHQMERAPLLFEAYNTKVLTQGCKKPMKTLYSNLMLRDVSLHGICSYYGLNNLQVEGISNGVV